MFTFIYAKHKIHPKIEKTHEQWYLLIDNKISLFSFLELKSKSIVDTYIKLKDKYIKNPNKNGHFVGEEETFIGLTLECNPQSSVVGDCKVLDSFLNGYRNMFIREEKLIISPNGAFRNIDNTFEILNTIKRKELIFPMTSEKDIRILKWKNGKHYYAKIGNQDVFWRGKQKWNSESEAMKNAKEYLKNLKGGINHENNKKN